MTQRSMTQCSIPTGCLSRLQDHCPAGAPRWGWVVVQKPWISMGQGCKQQGLDATLHDAMLHTDGLSVPPSRSLPRWGAALGLGGGVQLGLFFLASSALLGGVLLVAGLVTAPWRKE